MKKPQLISVFGPNVAGSTSIIYELGLELGKAMIDNGFWIVCGGKGGLMEAVCKGAHQSKHYTFGCTVGIIPEIDAEEANAYCDIIIPTGMGIARNFLVANTGQKAIAIAGGSGTLSEIAYAWQRGKTIIAYKGFGGWSEKTADQILDARSYIPVQSAISVGEIIHLLQS